MSEGSPGPEVSHPTADVASQRLMLIAERIATFRREIMPELTQAINDYLRSAVPQSATEKKDTARQVNSLLKALGFAIEHSGKTCSMYAVSGPKDAKGRFRIQPWDSKAALAQSANPADLLPLVLIDTVLSQDLSPEKASTSQVSSEWRSLVNESESGVKTR